jgi:hypothetical protein
MQTKSSYLKSVKDLLYKYDEITGMYFYKAVEAESNILNIGRGKKKNLIKVLPLYLSDVIHKINSCEYGENVQNVWKDIFSIFEFAKKNYHDRPDIITIGLKIEEEFIKKRVKLDGELKESLEKIPCEIKEIDKPQLNDVEMKDDSAMEL